MTENLLLNALQKSVLGMYAAGLSTNEITKRTKLSEQSTAIVLKSASKRLGANNALHAMAIFCKQDRCQAAEASITNIAAK